MKVPRGTSALGVALFCCVSATYAAPPFPMTLTACKGYAIAKRGDGAILVRCPGAPLDKPLFVIAAGCCPNPVISNRQQTSFTIDCK